MEGTRVLSEEEIEMRKKEMLEFYKEQLEFLKVQHEFEKISAEIAEFRFQRTQFELAFANLVSESSKKEDTTKEK